MYIASKTINLKFHDLLILVNQSTIKHQVARIIHNVNYMHVLSMHAIVTELHQENSSLAHSCTFSGMGLVESPPIVKSRHIALALSPCLLSNILSRLSMTCCNSWLLQTLCLLNVFLPF